VIVAVDDFAELDLTSRHVREDEGVEGHQHFVIFAKFVRENKVYGDELRQPASATGRHPFYGVKVGLKSVPLHLDLHNYARRKTPFDGF
jgi:hypothetical protein